MINKIKELIAQDNIVELKCIDTEGFIDANPINEKILKTSLIVTRIDEDGDIELEGSNYIIDSEFRYFEIKED